MAERQFAETTKPGDLIEIFRGTYQHWAIYIGGGEVVHLCVAGENSSSFSLTADKAIVQRAKFSEVVGRDKFKVNNIQDPKYKPHDPEIIVKEALAMVDRVVPYSVISYNCEHFVTNLRYGKPQSRQVQDAAVAAGMAAGVAGIVALGAVWLSLLTENKKNKHQGWDD